MKVGPVVAALVLAGACSSPELASVSAGDGPPAYVFRAVSVFDGLERQENRDVVVSAGRIEAVGAAGDVSVPPAAVEIAGAGRTLLPGLIDSHMHLFSAGEKAGSPPAPEEIAGAFLFAGVTTALVAAGFDEVTALESARNTGTLTPRLFTAGPGLTAPDGHPVPLLRAMLPWPLSTFAVMNVVSAADAQEARAQVRQAIAESRPTFFKIIFDDLPPGSPRLSVEALHAAVDEARANGLRPIVHATLPEDVMAAVEAGASALVHVPQRGVLSDDQVARILEAGAARDHDRADGVGQPSSGRGRTVGARTPDVRRSVARAVDGRAGLEPRGLLGRVRPPAGGGRRDDRNQLPQVAGCGRAVAGGHGLGCAWRVPWRVAPW